MIAETEGIGISHEIKRKMDFVWQTLQHFMDEKRRELRR
jgi:hypothetical protein